MSRVGHHLLSHCGCVVSHGPQAQECAHQMPLHVVSDGASQEQVVHSADSRQCAYCRMAAGSRACAPVKCCHMMSRSGTPSRQVCSRLRPAFSACTSWTEPSQEICHLAATAMRTSLVSTLFTPCAIPETPRTMPVLHAADFCVEPLGWCLTLPLCTDFTTLVCHATPAASLYSVI